MVIVEFKKLHFVPTVRALQGVIPKRRKNSSTPLIETTKNMMFFFRYSPMQMFVNFTASYGKTGQLLRVSGAAVPFRTVRSTAMLARSATGEVNTVIYLYPAC